MSIGKTLVSLSHRNRWLLFSSIVQQDKNYLPDKSRQVNLFADQDDSFDHRIFKKAERLSKRYGVT